MGRDTGSKNRNYPPLVLNEALEVAKAIEDKASGMEVSRLTLADYLGTTPSSSNFRELVASSRAYGLTEGGINANEFSLTDLGRGATGADEVVQGAALKQAVMNVQPFKTFLNAYSGKKVPSGPSFKEYLLKNAAVPEQRLEDCMEHILADATTAGLTRVMQNVPYIDLEGVPAPQPDASSNGHHSDAAALDLVTGVEAEAEEAMDRHADGPGHERAPLLGKPKKVFIAHGKNHTPLDQLKKALDQFKVQYAVAINEPNAGRPISKKVASLMRDECSSGIFIFTADERFERENKDGECQEVWRPSENVVYELGAASILYENRIVIFKEKGVSFPSDFSDLGYIEFEKDQLVAELGSLFAELVALDVLEVRAKG
jgi:predicted nucleotide-binding protein